MNTLPQLYANLIQTGMVSMGLALSALYIATL